jgi:hypothetical protein
MLDEQWRMAHAISDAVSELFYESRLKVAEPARIDEPWLRDRQTPATRLVAGGNVVLVDTGAAPKPASRFRGYECEQSANLIAALVVDHVLSWSITNIPEQLIVLTPYRAQRRRIEAELNSVNVPASVVSTVHRAQGSERRLVIFDPVCPTADFVAGEEGMRLVNVAFSRAQCRLIVMLQHGWQQHPALCFLARRYPPIVLNGHEVSELLLKKLPASRTPRPETPDSRTAHDRPREQTHFEEFVSLLRQRVPKGACKADVQRAAIELRDKAKFRKMKYSEIDAAIDTVFRG